MLTAYNIYPKSEVKKEGIGIEKFITLDNAEFIEYSRFL